MDARPVAPSLSLPNKKHRRPRSPESKLGYVKTTMLPLERAYRVATSGQNLAPYLVKEHVHAIVADLADIHERSRDLGNLKGRHNIIGRSARGLKVEVDLTIVGDLVPVSDDKLLSSRAAS